MLQELEKYKSLLGNSGSVLDIGAGNGETASLFDKNWKWIGIDPQPSHTIIPREERLVVGDVHNLNFEDESFDLVISIAALEHFHSPWLATKEINRVLKKGGYFLGTVSFLEPEHMNSYFHMTKNGTKKILEVADFKDISITPTSGWNVLTSMNIIPFTSIYSRIKSALLFPIRRSLIKLRIFFRKGKLKNRAQKYLEDDESRYAGSFFFICKKG